MLTPTIHLGLSGRARRHVGQAFGAARQPMLLASAPAATWHRGATAPEFVGCDATGLAKFAPTYGSQTGMEAAVKHTINRHTWPLGTRLT